MSGGDLSQAGEACQARPTVGRLTAYGAVALPLSLAEIPILLYLPAFYAQEMGMAAGVVGVVFLCARLWEGLTDIFVGGFSDRTASRFGRRKPWVVAALPLLMLSTWFLCNPPKGAGIVYLAFWALLFYASHTAAKIPHLSWGAELAEDYVERSRVTSFRETFTMVGNLAFVMGPLLLLGDAAPLREILLVIAVSVLILAPLTMIPIAIVVPDPPRLRTTAPLLKALLPLLRDRALVLFLTASMLYWMGVSVSNSVAVFTFSVGLGLPKALLWIVLILYIAMLLAVPAVMWLSKRVEKHHLLAGGLVLGSITGLLVWAPMHSFALVAATFAFSAIGSAAAFIIPTSMLADIIDRGEAATDEKRSGAYVALYNLASKIGLALGVGVSFVLLQLFNYEPSATHHGASDISHIRLIGLGMPALLWIVALSIYLRHPITKQAQRALRATIAARGVS